MFTPLFAPWLIGLYKGASIAIPALISALGIKKTSDASKDALKLQKSVYDDADFRRASYGTELTPAQREENEFNAQQATLAYERERELRQTAYQDTVSDMRSAGINPAMMYGGSAGATATSAPASATSSSAGADPSAMVNLVKGIAEIQMMKNQQKLDYMSTIADISKTYAETANIKKNTEETDVDINLKNLDLTFSKETIDARIDAVKLTPQQLSTSIEVAKKSLETADADIALKKVGLEREDVALLMDSINLGLLQTYGNDLARLNVKEKQLNVNYTIGRIRQQPAELKKINAEINNIYADSILKGAQKGLIEEQTITEFKQQGLIDAQTADTLLGVQQKRIDLKDAEVSLAEHKWQVKNKRLFTALDYGLRFIGAVTPLAVAHSLEEKNKPVPRAKVGY